MPPAPPVLLLLPPSERKRGASRGRPLDVAALSCPQLNPARLAVLSALADVSAGPQAASVLGVGPGSAPEVAANTRWRRESAQRVEDLYTGVLFASLGLDTLPAAARRRARDWVRVVSAAHGLLRLDDAVPAYRLAMGVSLPGVGALGAHCRPHLAGVLDPLLAEGPRLVLDARSAAYAAAWAPPRDLAPQVVTLQVLTDAAGVRRVVSHAAKHTRGLVARHLLTRPGRAPRTPDALVSAIGEVFEVEDAGHRPGRPRRVDVLVRA